ncbi:MAG TPA: 50S ribosomal protein L25/general stress protein Ctc [Kaistella sp.]|jgi:LSU ribosomal protein L25P|uniref:50S ribosomal protein L25/general stress protein Ctc n=1 Tax=Candidatus Kaistella beijingensis TaxID=2820270 RepID=UPI0019F93869|nr:50S ribosomal protein L25/general stress protein Ctc [Candidatus Kaistella beijingensis]MBE2273913.1 50S ribosomal protein L25/general stress protein Ctc [Flavobacteriales bacterium]MCA0391190.1 50S ribosomal protein L25/general stress protein Ctc [Bacteroidota bacterium]HMU06875.1 50S ribosomal protein L25/general stress protein Ctc [Kaistella sp.]MBN8622297.1 50S ribosomal protein L25/general stress protein Ctc [Flavobacteriales bacterium]UBB89050.1 50S ribosomal protein L25/general stres
MKSITIQGTKRESVGKKSTKALRDAELVPCVVYGGKETLNFSAEERSFKGLVYTPEAHTVSIEVDGNTIPAVLQDIQFHPITDKILHADFYQLSDDKAVVMEVPVRLTGRAKGVVAGGALRQSFRKLKLKAIPANLPDEIVVDVTPLKIGNKLYVGDIKADGFTFMHPDNAVVVAVKMSRTAMKGGAAAMDEEDELEAEEVKDQSPDVPTTEEKSTEA